MHLSLDVVALQAALSALGHETLVLHSAAADRDTYLKRPDLGRKLDAPSRQTLSDRAKWTGPDASQVDGRQHDVAFMIADGLSALAVGLHALPLLDGVLPSLRADGWSIAPLVIIEQGRVAIQDEVGDLLGARLAVILIGERPGLSSADSMGLYMTWMPRPGLTDADRNCISNVRPEGLPSHKAAEKLLRLLRESKRLKMSGVGLKDEHPSLTAAPSPVLGPGQMVPPP